MKLLSSFRKIDSIFIHGSLIYFLIMILNFALSASPYSSLHSGRVGNYGIDANFYFNTAYSMICSFGLVCIIRKSIKIDNIAKLMCLLILLSLLINFNFNDIKSYLYDILTIIMVSLMASYDIRKQNTYKCTSEPYSIDIFQKCICLLIILGFILAVLFPGRYGFLTSSMSREERGEVTLWVMLCLPVLALTSQLTQMLRNNASKLYLIVGCFACIVTCMTASRTAFLVYGICIGLFYLLKVRNKLILYISVPVILVLLFTSNAVREIFFLGHSSMTEENVAEILNGRYDLWIFYYETFINNIMFGAGPNVLTENIAMFLGASSEVGILKTAASYGIGPTLLEIYMIIHSFKALKKIYTSPNAYTQYDIFIAFLFLSSIILIIQQHARIQNYGNLVCWYSMFYMYNLNNRKLWN